MKVKINFLLLSIIINLVLSQANHDIIKGKEILGNFNRNTFRKISDNNNFEPIRIHCDFSYLKKKVQNNQNLLSIEKEVENSINNSIKIIKKLINIRPLTYPINKITLNDLSEWGFDSNYIDKLLLTNGNGINADLVILLKFIEQNEQSLLLDNEMASISNKFILDEETKRPIVGVIYINNNINMNIENINIYLQYIFLHEITHILGFYYDLFQYFPGGLEKTIKTEKEERTNIEKKFIITPKVVEFSKKYFNCNELNGVELENQHNISWSHWEARILLGEYMTSSSYTPEQVISEFTLALLEDSGWYKVNYYTGGLMRFGKNKGCDFLKKDCENKHLETNFKYEFCDFLKGNQPTCSLGRQSRTYCKSYTKLEINESDYLKNYVRFEKWFGRKNADNCPVNDIEINEEKNTYYVGNCHYGNGKYGTHNNFNDETKSNEDFEDILGEKYGDNSFCAISNILPEEDSNRFGSQKKAYRAVCYPMFCSSKSLTIQIYDQYIVCPRQGGKVEINGKYNGYLICPDYNLICTGTKLCNDMFDCVEKESLSKEDTYKYDYDINYDEEKIFKEGEINELGDDGICPQNCVQCEGKAKCIKWTEGYETEIQYNDWTIVKKFDIEIKKDNLKENMDIIVQDFIKKNNDNEKLMIDYNDKQENISIIIYKDKGNKEYLESITSDNEKELLNVLNGNNSNNSKIKVIIKTNGDYYILVYDENGIKLNIKDECPNCINIKINITNNYEKNIDKFFGESIKNIIANNKIDIFDSEDPIFNDICANFTIAGIDIPLDSRKDILFKGDNKNEIICGNDNCYDIYNNINEFEVKCECDINFELNNNINDNIIKGNKNEKRHNRTSSAQTVKNTFEIFKCFKDGNFLKTNEGFYISVCTIGIQSICFLFYIILKPKIPLLPFGQIPVANPIGKKNNKEKKYQKANSFKTEDSGDVMNDEEKNKQKDILQKPIIIDCTGTIDNNVMSFGNIDEDIIDDEKGSNNNKGINNTNYHCPETREIKLDTIKIENKITFKIERNSSRNTINENMKSLDKNSAQYKKQFLEKKTQDNLNTIQNENINTNARIYETPTEENNNNNINKPRGSLDVDSFSLHGSVNKKLNIKEEEKEFDEKSRNKKILILFGNKNNTKSSQEKMKTKEKPIPLDYLPIKKAIQFDKRSLGIIYWCIFSFKQPLINLFSIFDIFKVTNSCIPIQMKLMRFLFMLILNLFINSMTITQNYFKDKYEYFNEKYKLVESDNIKIKIDILERLSYAMKHSFPEVIITFIICMFVQFIINFLFFGIRRELCFIAINERRENILKAVQKLTNKTKVRYIIFAFINLTFMIIFFVYLTNFSNTYSGGAIDYIGAGIWTFIFLQVLPIFSSLITALLRYYGMKNNKEGMYKMSQVLLA